MHLKFDKGVFMNSQNSFDFVLAYNRDLGVWVDSKGRPAFDSETNSPAEIEDIPPFLQEKKQIETLTSINGLSIEEIEQRARPSSFSQSGFIGKEESFKDVLMKDWETVEKLNITHGELAAHLRRIISLAESSRRISMRASLGPIAIEYKTGDLKENTIISEGHQNLEVVLWSTKGMQDDIFAPKKNLQREVNTPCGWNEENIIRNIAMGIELRINSGILSYIREFGFYEGGGEENPYRIDPKKVMTLLTGKLYLQD
jgi:hypothetical protein